MHWIDWIIVALPLLIVLIIGLRTRRYVTGVADFLTAGRVAGRYVVSVASGEAGMGLVSLVGIFEMYYNSGFAFRFWSGVTAPIGLFMSLTGYCIYRFRESRAMTMGQFLEMRYSRKFRIFAAILQSISGVVNYAIFPAVSARFIVYYCGFPQTFDFLGLTWSSFHVVMLLFLSIAVLITTLGGQITVMVWYRICRIYCLEPDLAMAPALVGQLVLVRLHLHYGAKCRSHRFLVRYLWYA